MPLVVFRVIFEFQAFQQAITAQKKAPPIEGASSNIVIAFVAAGLVRAQAGHAGAALSSTAVAAVTVARLLIEFSATHFLLDTRVLNQFSEPLDRVLNPLPVS